MSSICYDFNNHCKFLKQQHSKLKCLPSPSTCRSLLPIRFKLIEHHSEMTTIAHPRHRIRHRNPCKHVIYTTNSSSLFGAISPLLRLSTVRTVHNKNINGSILAASILISTSRKNQSGAVTTGVISSSKRNVNSPSLLQSPSLPNPVHAKRCNRHVVEQVNEAQKNSKFKTVHHHRVSKFRLQCHRYRWLKRGYLTSPETICSSISISSTTTAAWNEIRTAQFQQKHNDNVQKCIT